MEAFKQSPSIGLDDTVGEPEVRLWRATVMQAIADSLDPQERQGIIEWVLTVDFETVCELAGLNPDKLGRRLTEILMAHKPRSIVLANILKSDVERGALSVC